MKISCRYGWIQDGWAEKAFYKEEDYHYIVASDLSWRAVDVLKALAN